MSVFYCQLWKRPIIISIFAYSLSLLLLCKYVTTFLSLFPLPTQTSSGSRRGFRVNERWKGGENSIVYSRSPDQASIQKTPLNFFYKVFFPKEIHLIGKSQTQNYILFFTLSIKSQLVVAVVLHQHCSNTVHLHRRNNHNISHSPIRACYNWLRIRVDSSE